MSVLHVHVRAACPRPCCSPRPRRSPRPCCMSNCHCPCPCCTSDIQCSFCMSMSMLYTYVHAACLCPCCMTMSISQTWTKHGDVHRLRHGKGHRRMEANNYGKPYQYLQIRTFFKHQISDIARNVSPISEIISDWLPFSPTSEWSDIGVSPISKWADSRLNAQLCQFTTRLPKPLKHF
jgi:hypothetical protein